MSDRGKPRRRQPRFTSLALFSLTLYLAGVLAFSVLIYNTSLERTLTETDRYLRMAACSLKHLVAEDFHDRAVGPGAISFEEEMKNRCAVNSFVAEAGLIWAYTLVEEGGRFYFAAPTVTGEEGRSRKSWYYYPYDDIPDAFRRTYEKGETVYVSYRDQWGDFRSVAIAETTPGGRRYLACADIDSDHLATLAHDDARMITLIGLFLLVLILPLVFLLRSQRKRLLSAMRTLSRHKELLEETVQIRTSELVRAQEALRERAVRDPLTRLYNRGFVLERLREEIGRLPEGGSLCLMMIDLDRFKAVNDAKGHLAGDRILKAVSVLIRQNVRHTDIVGRFGGDEFLIVLPDTGLEGACVVGDKLCRLVKESPLEDGGHSLSFSIGIACCRGESHATGLLTEADRLLYEAKRRGGDCVVAEAVA